MNEVTPDQLKQAVEVHERFKDQTVWQGVIHVFNLTGHPLCLVVTRRRIGPAQVLRSAGTAADRVGI
ncbi:MAG: hypothetical protein ACHQ50_02020 [Fimbriimonadales bacterium]